MNETEDFYTNLKTVLKTVWSYLYEDLISPLFIFEDDPEGGSIIMQDFKVKRKLKIFFCTIQLLKHSFLFYQDLMDLRSPPFHTLAIISSLNVFNQSLTLMNKHSHVVQNWIQLFDMATLNTLTYLISSLDEEVFILYQFELTL